MSDLIEPKLGLTSKLIKTMLTVGVVEFPSGKGQISRVTFFGWGIAELFTIATMATDKLTLIAYTFANPRNPKIPRTYLAFSNLVVSFTKILKTLFKFN